MRFAILGSGDDAAQLARAVQQSDQHQLVAVSETGDVVLSGAPPATHWELLLEESVTDAVIIGQTDDPERRAGQLRQLVQAGVPMVLVHPACETIVGYELDMIRQDTQCIMQPYCPGIAHPAMEELGKLLAQGSDGPLGTVEQLVFDRPMVDRARPRVWAQFARDVFLIRQALGNVSRLSAMGSAADHPNYSNLNVQMSGPGHVLARWSLGPVHQQPQARLSVLGTGGTAMIDLHRDESEWAWQETREGQSSDRSWPTWRGPAAAVDRLAQAAAGNVPTPTWDDACRACDLADLVDVSLRRGRTIDVHTQTCTEEDTFKGMMAIGGCAALLFTLVVVVLLAVVESFDLAFLEHSIWQRSPWRFLYWRNWPFYLVGLLLLFLSLQLLRLLFPRSWRKDPPVDASKAKDKAEKQP